VQKGTGMEATACDMKSSLNPKGSSTPLVKDLATSSTQAIQPGRNSLFAGMLGQNISQATCLDSMPDCTAASPCGENPLLSSMAEVTLKINGESEMTNNSSASEMENSDFEEGPTLIQFLQFMAVPQREDTSLQFAGLAENNSLSLTENMEPTRDTKTAIHLLKGMMEQTAVIPEASEITSSAALPQTENATCATVTLFKADAALFAQAVKPQKVARLEREAVESPTGKFILEEAADSPISIPREIRPLSDRSPNHRLPSDSADHRTEPPLTERAWIAAAPQKPTSAVSDSDAMIGQAISELTQPEGSPNKNLYIRDVVTEILGSSHNHQQNQNTVSNNPMGISERDILPFRMEMSTIVSPQETHSPVTVLSDKIEMQTVIDQILVARQGAKNDFGRIRILLNPPNLGAVDLDVIVRGERVEVVMTADNTTVQQALQSRADDIRMALQRQDLKIEGFQVLLQDTGMSQQQSNSGAMYRQNREYQERLNANEDAPPVSPVISSIVGAKSATGLVSIFA
jgi:flagellar hook-length control protein FliK